jgi:hypothetical protein
VRHAVLLVQVPQLLSQLQKELYLVSLNPVSTQDVQAVELVQLKHPLLHDEHEFDTL